MTELTPQEFARRWSATTLSERSASQQHFIDLCRMLGKPTPAEADPDGDFYTFEKSVRKSGGEGEGEKGFADVFYRGRFAWEYKGKHKDLSAAYRQLQLYREDLENPPLLVVSDMERYEVHTNFTSAVKKVYSFTNDELPQPENLEILRALFENPQSLRPGRTPEGVTEEVAAKFAHLADGLRDRGEDPEQAAHFLNKLLFCLFAEDMGLLPNNLFSKLVERSLRYPERFTGYAGELFSAMAEGGEVNWEDIRHFNGGLFDEGGALSLTKEELSILLEAARLDWGSVEPAIFGTLFERSLDPDRRSQLGAHYTGRDDILAIVEPVLMEPLRREWAQVREEVDSLAAREHPADGPQRTRSINRTRSQMESKLSSFAGRLREVRVLDPACGSGNFLYVSLRELLELEKEVSTYSSRVGLNPFFPEVSPEQLHGIEISPYARELAQVVIWIGYLQWMIENGFGVGKEPILGPMTNILLMDAIVEEDGKGNVGEPEWPQADVIIGNPPFLGSKRLRSELEDGYVDEMFSVYDGRVPREADLVCYWFEKARSQIEGGEARRAGLLATNSIRGGANRRSLERINESGGIFFAESDRPWVLEGAAVRVSMVGFDRGEDQERTLDGTPVAEIHANLTGGLDLTKAAVLEENKGLAFMGDTKGGPFDLPPEEARRLLSANGNPNGRPNSDVIKPWINGLDITRRPRGYHIIDFGVDMPLEDAALYEAPFEHVNENVRPQRENSRSTRNEWWLHERPRVDMRQALTGLTRFLGTARVAKHRLFWWFDGSTLPDSQIIAFAREDDYFFGVLHSRAHELWSFRTGTWMGAGNDLRYTPTSCFETFPFPAPDEGQRTGISEAARRLDELRCNWLEPEGASEAELKKRTLTNLYNQRPTWLEQAHHRLDEVVFAAYGWQSDIGEEEMLKNLLTLNLERAGSRL